MLEFFGWNQVKWRSFGKSLLLNTGPGWILLIAFVGVVLATVLIVLILPSPGWPPDWSQLDERSERIAVAAVIAGLVGSAGIVVSLWASLAEIRSLFPSQSFKVYVFMPTSGNPDLLDIELEIENGDSIVNAWRVELDVPPPAAIAPQVNSGWSYGSGPRGPDTVVYKQDTAPVFPHQLVPLGKVKLIDSPGHPQIGVRWWTDRGGEPRRTYAAGVRPETSGS